MILTQRLFPVDGIALPAFGPSGMENWGLIKYRETNLLLKEGETSSSSREGIGKLVAHEIGHQVRLILQYLSSCSASCTLVRERHNSLKTSGAQYCNTLSHALFSYNHMQQPLGRQWADNPSDIKFMTLVP